MNISLETITLLSKMYKDWRTSVSPFVLPHVLLLHVFNPLSFCLHPVICWFTAYRYRSRERELLVELLNALDLGFSFVYMFVVVEQIHSESNERCCLQFSLHCVCVCVAAWVYPQQRAEGDNVLQQNLTNYKSTGFRMHLFLLHTHIHTRLLRVSQVINCSEKKSQHKNHV